MFSNKKGEPVETFWASKDGVSQVTIDVSKVDEIKIKKVGGKFEIRLRNERQKVSYMKTFDKLEQSVVNPIFNLAITLKELGDEMYDFEEESVTDE